MEVMQAYQDAICLLACVDVHRSVRPGEDFDQLENVTDVKPIRNLARVYMAPMLLALSVLFI